MKLTVHILWILHLTAILVVVTLFQPVAFGQAQGQSQSPSSQTIKAPVQGYMRTNKHTGQPEQVRPYKRQLPKPKPVQVKPHMRGGRLINGHERQPPTKPIHGNAPATPIDKKAQADQPSGARPMRWIV